MIAAMADASYKKSIFHIERYQEHVMAKAHQIINRYDDDLTKESDIAKRMQIKREANREIAKMVKKETSDTLSKGFVRTEQSDEELLCEIGCINKI